MKIKVAVMFGGKSVEHEISIISAIQAISSFNTEKYEIIPMYITKKNEFYIGEQIGRIESYKDINALLKNSQRVLLVNTDDKVEMVKYPFKAFGKNTLGNIDVVFPIVHGTNVEDGTLQGYLNMLDIPFVGCDVLASAVGMDKYVMKTVLKDNNIPVLDCLCFTSRDFERSDEMISQIEGKFEYPVIVKPINLGSSIGISKVEESKQLYDALAVAFSFAEKILVEPAVLNLREINCAVLGDIDDAIASECEEPLNSNAILSFNDKYIGGAKDSASKGMASAKRKIPADISPEIKAEIQKIAVDAFKCLGCNGVSRIDFLLDGKTNKVWLNEINTIPGSLAFYLWDAAGIKYDVLLDKMISLSLKRQRNQQNIVYSFDSNVLAGVSFGGKSGVKS